MQRIRVRCATGAWFASDMHLDDARPELTTRFLDALDALAAPGLDALAAPGAAGPLPQGAPPTARIDGDEGPALFLLGDLFEVWIGDDAVSGVAERVAARLRALRDRGWRIFIMRGNRDFLIDVPVPGAQTPTYTDRCAAQLLDDPAILVVGTRSFLLSHGDIWCTDDAAYVAWRARSRSPAWQQGVLRRSRLMRRWLGRWARWRSRRNAARGARVMAPDDAAPDMTGPAGSQEGSPTGQTPPGDIALPALAASMDRHDVDAVIHGHTHRPAVHRWMLNDRHRWRWVLSDWSARPGHERGAIVSLARALADGADPTP